MSEEEHRSAIEANSSDGDPVGKSVDLVAIGASAGGLEALKDFLSATPSDSGCCFVFVQHLDPTHKSLLPELLGRCTDMKVLQASDNLVPEPNTVVLIPPDATLTYASGHLHIQRPAPPRKHRTPIDSFFDSIASELGEEAICILLSGTGSDGTHGLSRVKEAGGLTIVQSAETAKYDSMPRNAVATGFVDYELSPSQMPAIIVEHLRKVGDLETTGEPDGLRQQMIKDLFDICSILRARTSHDFREYKEATLLRRIQRRMHVLRIDEPAQYAERLRTDPAEVGKLLHELLISVTGFFRDPQAFNVLVATVIEPLIAGAQPGVALRIWIPGCATGEEAYTIAMIVHDRVQVSGKQLKIQLFATDIDEHALETARRGCYADALLAAVPTEYRNRYFRVEGAGFRVADELREMCIFSSQSVIKDPPFSRIDLISCRNLLIYLKPELQSRLIPLLHYALRPGGALFLGPSENITKHRNHFDVIDGKWRIFRKKDVERVAGRTLPLAPLMAASPRHDSLENRDSDTRPAAPMVHAERLVLDKMGPAYAVISQDRELLFTGGGIARYLSVPEGAATQELIAMTRPELRIDIRALVHRAMVDGVRTRRENISFDDGNRRVRLRLECAPLEHGSEKQLYVLVIHDCGDGDIFPSGQGNADASSAAVQALERELGATKEHLQTTTEELESSNEELKSANEELMSINEELQSSNEELETAKEELQSINEELETVNSELAAKIEDLGRSNADLQNLLESTQIATLFLDRSLRVRRFTPIAKELFHFIDTDLGRSISDIAPRLHEPGLEKLVRKVLSSTRAMKKRVKLRGANRSFVMHVLPYKTSGEVIDGVVVTFVDVSELAQAQASAERRASQQGYLADLSGRILRGEKTDEILQAAPRRIAELLNGDFCKVLKKQPDGDDFELIANYGFRASAGQIVPGGERSQAGYTARSREPVIVEDLKAEKRFSGPKLLTEHDVRSGISTVILGPDGNWGVLGVHSKEVRSFSAEDILFIQAVANLLSTGLRQELSMKTIRESEERLGSALRAGDLGVHDFDPRTGLVKWDEVVRGLWGVADDVQITYGVFMRGVHPDDREEVQAAIDEALKPDGEGSYEATYRVVNAQDGDTRWVRADGEVTFENDVAIRLVGTVSDVTERRRNEEHIQILMREVNHRAKNLLAVVQSVARQTVRNSSPEEFSQYLSQRLQGLAASQDLIIEGQWRSVSIADLVHSQLQHLGADLDKRVHLLGDPVLVTPAAAQGIGLALHELATNAVKYGALSADNGHVDVLWSRTNVDGEKQFGITWIEKDGPKVVPPVRRGFGSVVIEQLASSSVSGTVNLQFEPTGLRWHLSAPEKNVVYDSSSSALLERPLAFSLATD